MSRYLPSLTTEVLFISHGSKDPGLWQSVHSQAAVAGDEIGQEGERMTHWRAGILTARDAGLPAA